MDLIILNANASHIPLADETVQCCVTSPPYYLLRDYGTARWIGGTDPNCDHREKRGGNGSRSKKQITSTGTQTYQYRNVCAKCGAMSIDLQIGMEKTPEEYIENLVCVFREVWRVMKPDGTLWLNLGDSYATGQKGGEKEHLGDKSYTNKGSLNIPKLKPNNGLKPKNLMMIPARVAMALQAVGWYLRSEIVWHKSNPMTEPVKDRPTRSHEMIYLLSKSEKYYYDYEAILEPSIGRKGKQNSFARKVQESPPPGQRNQHRENREDIEYSGMRNMRDVWTVATQSYRGAHFATYPEKLIEPCILAGSRVGDYVLDPFAGSGTTGRVSIRYNRKFIGLDLNPKYIEIAKDRTNEVQRRFI